MDVFHRLNNSSSTEEIVMCLANIQDENGPVDLIQKVQVASEAAEMIQCDDSRGRELQDEICHSDHLLSQIYRFITDVPAPTSVGSESDNDAELSLPANRHPVLSAIYMSTLSALIIHNPNRLVEFLRSNDRHFINVLTNNLDLLPYRAILVSLCRVGAVHEDTCEWLKAEKIHGKLIEVLKSNNVELCYGACEVMLDIVRSIRSSDSQTSLPANDASDTNTIPTDIIRDFISREVLQELLQLVFTDTDSEVSTNDEYRKQQTVNYLSILLALIQPAYSNATETDSDINVDLDSEIRANYLHVITPHLKHVPSILNRPPMRCDQSPQWCVGEVRVCVVKLLTYTLHIVTTTSQLDSKVEELLHELMCQNIIHIIVKLFAHFTQSSVFHNAVTEFIRACFAVAETTSTLTSLSSSVETSGTSSNLHDDIVKHMVCDSRLLETLMSMWRRCDGDVKRCDSSNSADVTVAGCVGYVGHASHLINLINSHVEMMTVTGRYVSSLIDTELSSEVKSKWEQFISCELEEYNAVSERPLCGIERSELDAAVSVGVGVGAGGDGGEVTVRVTVGGAGGTPDEYTERMVMTSTAATAYSCLLMTRQEEELFKAFQQQIMSTPFDDDFGLAKLEANFEAHINDDPIDAPIERVCNFDVEIHEDEVDVEERFSSIQVDISVFDADDGEGCDSDADDTT